MRERIRKERRKREGIQKSKMRKIKERRGICKKENVTSR